MIQKPATKQPLTKVPGHTHLFRRGATYYFRVGVPKELRKAIGKTEIIKSLRTTDFARAKGLVSLESVRANARLESERRKLQPVAKSNLSLTSLSDTEIHRLVVEWFIGLEKDSEERFATEGLSFDPEETAEAVDNLRVEVAVFSGGNKDYRAEDGSGDLNRFLAERGIDADLRSSSYQKMRELFRRARLQNARRQLDRYEGQTFEITDPLWKDVFAHTAPSKPSTSTIKLGDFLDRFLKFIKENRSETTFTTYQTPVRIMEDILGRDRPLATVNREDIEQLCEALKSRPKNAQQRYPNLTNQEAVAEATIRGDTQKLGAKALENYFRNILAVFNFAVEEKYIKENPAGYRSLREQFRCKTRTKKAKFTNHELNDIFHAPVFTGCVDDEAGFAKQGENGPRRGRFWVPLLALFQGVRCNEACQFYAQDVKELDGIPYLAIRTALDDYESTDKRLKNVSSTRNVPIHPTLIQIGFLDFVASRRCDKESNRLFSELKAGTTGRYSNPFSKWFSRFLETTFRVKPKGTFHSFRHHFRDALRDARVSEENTEALGGWASEDQEHRNYGNGPKLRILLEDLSKVDYPELNLEHLW